MKSHRHPVRVCIGGAVGIVAAPVALQQLHVQDPILDVPSALLLLDLSIPTSLQDCAFPDLDFHSARRHVHFDLHCTEKSHWPSW